MTAELRTLDLLPMYGKTAELLTKIKESLAVPMQFSDPDEPTELVYGQVLPEDLRQDKTYLLFHADIEKAPSGTDLITAHLRYRKRPSGSPPKYLKNHRASGRTVAWVERAFMELGRAVMFVEAELELPSAERRKTHPIPSISVGGAILKHRGEEYRGEIAVGLISKYRWLELPGGTTTIWLAYSHTLDMQLGFWDHEKKRCLDHLQQLGF